MSTEIREKTEAQFRRNKEKLLIVIFGSYEPEEEMTKLRTLKQHLISCGYSKATLVEDYRTEDIVPVAIVEETERLYVKSTTMCRLSHCNFIVATHEGIGRGWINELTYCCRECPDGIAKTAVFDEERDTDSALGAVNLGMTSLHGMAYEPFHDMDGLRKAGERVALKYLIRLLDKLSSE